MTTLSEDAALLLLSAFSAMQLHTAMAKAMLWLAGCCQRVIVLFSLRGPMTRGRGAAAAWRRP